MLPAPRPTGRCRRPPPARPTHRRVLPRLRTVSRPVEQAGGVLPDGLEQSGSSPSGAYSEPRPGTARPVRSARASTSSSSPATCSAAVQGEAAREDRQPSQQQLLLPGQQGVTPVQTSPASSAAGPGRSRLRPTPRSELGGGRAVPRGQRAGVGRASSKASGTPSSRRQIRRSPVPTRGSSPYAGRGGPGAGEEQLRGRGASTASRVRPRREAKQRRDG